jgi:hypothetical protein
MKMRIFSYMLLAFSGIVLAQQATAPPTSRAPQFLWEFDTGG